MEPQQPFGESHQVAAQVRARRAGRSADEQAREDAALAADGAARDARDAGFHINAAQVHIRWIFRQDYWDPL
jgi:hypothetical protein